MHSKVEQLKSRSASKSKIKVADKKLLVYNSVLLYKLSPQYKLYGKKLLQFTILCYSIR